ncbi:MAG: DUF3868 domain-containing protein [Bacteroidales bacterium]|nr:DUF3868 domain-containing protein [Bacteroidales bacterium]
MKRTALILSLLAISGIASSAQTEESISTPAGGNIIRRGDMMKIDIAVDLSDLDIRSNRFVVLTPRLVNGNDTLTFESLGIYGRRQYIYTQRNEDKLLQGFEDVCFTDKDAPRSYQWIEEVEYRPWMHGAVLELHRQMYGCCNERMSRESFVLNGYEDIFYVPEFIYVTPPVELEKTREMSGSAYIDFPVSRTEIRPDYRNNRAEIGKILSSIDSLESDADIEVKSLTIKGFASPEGKYANNERLAKGRTEALKEYVSSQYDFGRDFIRTAYEPEDWRGLEAYVAASSLEHRNEIIDIINSGLDPDAREAKIKKEYPSEYKILLEECYPALRHSDYAIEYSIRSFADPQEILKVYEKAPGKLSQNEIFILSTIYEPGSEEFNEVFEVIVALYPESAEANLNAANAAMSRGDLIKAEKYLSKAGDRKEADYARGVLEALSKDYVQAQAFFRKAAEGGMEKAEEKAASMDEFIARARL